MHCRGSFAESPRRDETQVRSLGWLHQLDRSAPDHRVSGSIEFQKINPVIRTGDNTNCIGHTYVFNHSVPEHCVLENQSGDLLRWITGLMVIPHCIRWYVSVTTPIASVIHTCVTIVWLSIVFQKINPVICNGGSPVSWWSATAVDMWDETKSHALNSYTNYSTFWQQNRSSWWVQ